MRKILDSKADPVHAQASPIRKRVKILDSKADPALPLKADPALPLPFLVPLLPDPFPFPRGGTPPTSTARRFALPLKKLVRSRSRRFSNLPAFASVSAFLVRLS